MSRSNSAPFMQRGQEIELNIDDLAFGGKGITRQKDFVIFIPNTVPGQSVRARIINVKPRWAEARCQKVLTKSPLEIVPQCPYFRACGGCSHQDIPYEYQLTFLHRQVTDLYQRLGGFKTVRIAEPIPSANIFHYRNKMEFAFSDRRWIIADFDEDKPRDFALGLRASGNYRKAIDIDRCLIAPQESDTILAFVKSFVRQKRLSPHNQQNHDGLLRHLVIRKALHSNELLVNLVIHEDQPQLFKPLADNLRKNFPNLTGFIVSVSRNLSGTTVGEKVYTLYGKDHINEKLGPLIFTISPQTFFQTNTLTAEKLYETVIDYADLQGDNIVWDLYCGAGSIALYMASKARRVIGFELEADAVRNAKTNAANNHIDNADFIQGNLNRIFQTSPHILRELPAPDTLIVDPPRSGMHSKLIKTVAQIRPVKIVYVSCNPATQVRDIRQLIRAAPYRIDAVQPVDLFPHTPHVEVITRLSINP